MHIEFAPLAASDLEHIGDYIAHDNPQKAVGFIRELQSRCLDLQHFPAATRLIPAFGPDARILPFRNHLILYTFKDNQIRIERIVHGSRDLVSIIKN
ncbi:MAG: type II toxin-antitoxin system RelE/ParE family toxin [Cohaesibacteraceae bacterium]|nr:type II toxin-antitoxin system RelE/ParE family toxin [Cohaesibacteraceae bacterium]